MKAVIFNSGLGKRMGELTEHCHKSMVRLQSGEAIFERQLRLLHECGVNEFVVTVGPFKEQLIEASQAPHLADCTFTFVENPIYDKTNYIYSMFLARKHLTGDLLFLHGDLVFDRELVKAVLHDPAPSLGCVNRKKELPEKDFKARVENGCIQEVSVSIFDPDCFAFQPFYKLAAHDVAAWVERVEEFIADGKDQCYAENAMNTVFPDLSVREFDYSGFYVDEVDTPDDLRRVSAEIRRFDFAEQELKHGAAAVADLLGQYRLKKPFVVSGVPERVFCEYFEDILGFSYELFEDFTPNPDYNEVCEGVRQFRESGCDCILSIGGGSAIDVAKCVKLYSAMKDGEPYLRQAHVFSPVKHFAIPSTAGTGSESTRFAVIYYDGQKQSVTDDCIFPDAAVLDPSLLRGLPEYHKKSTLLDALCHATESMWSVNSDATSEGYAFAALRILLANAGAYLDGDEAAAGRILEAANLAGRAINLSQTTAAHAMSYKLTSAFGIAHGHAAALCLPEVWRYLAEHTEECTDSRGEQHLLTALGRLNDAFGCETADEAIDRLTALLTGFDLKPVECADEDRLRNLAASVNPQRLANYPVPLRYASLLEMYRRILAPAQG